MDELLKFNMKKIFCAWCLVVSIQSVAQQPVVVRTPNGSIVADTYVCSEDFKAADIEYLSNQLKKIYPRAEVLKPATTTYNCHAYAWHVSEGGNAVWMGMNTNPTSIYWTDGSYIEISNPIEGAKVSYANDNHSAIVTNDVSVFVSKWGKWQLIKHDKDYGPYESSRLRYFVKFKPVLNGPTQICNATGTFKLINLPVGATVQWSTGGRWDALELASGQGTAQATYRATGSGQATVSVSVNYLKATTTLSHTVQVGVPEPRIIGPFQNGHVMAGICACQSAHYEAATAPGITRYHWEMVDDSPYITLLGKNSRSMGFQVNPDARYAHIRCKQYQEGCGWSEITEEPIYFHDNCCRQWGIGPNPTPGPIELRPYRADGGEEVSLMRSATPSIVTLRQVHVFSADGRLVLERQFPIGTSQAGVDLSSLRQGTYHLLINGKEHHVVIKE